MVQGHVDPQRSHNHKSVHTLSLNDGIVLTPGVATLQYPHMRSTSLTTKIPKLTTQTGTSATQSFLQPWLPLKTMATETTTRLAQAGAIASVYTLLNGHFGA